MMKNALLTHFFARGRRWSAGVLLFVLPILVAACIPDGVRIPESPLLRQLERKTGLIVYVGTDFNIYTIDQAGENQVALTSDADVPPTGGRVLLYQFPSWSPDSERLAFVGIEGPSGDYDQVSVYTVNPDGSDLIQVISDPQEFPYYLYWSPDSERLSFLARNATRNGGVLKVVPAEGGEVQVVDTGEPYYWDWSPTSDQLLIHAGGNQGRVSFLDLSTPIKERGLGYVPTYFQAPAWSPKGDRVLLAAEGAGGVRELVLADQNGNYLDTLVEFEGSIAFAWSPDGEKIAYILNDDPFMIGSLGDLTIVDLDRRDEPITLEDIVIAFFWSPDSEKIAYFSPVVTTTGGGSDSGPGGGSETQIVLQQLQVFELGSEDIRDIGTFLPTDEFLSRLPYFDQYHHSVTIWSPDSDALVLSANTPEQGPAIWIAAASGTLTPRFITPGRIAYWSWR
jgi:Tol biopolymer transport system component